MYLEILFSIYKARTECIFKYFFSEHTFEDQAFSAVLFWGGSGTENLYLIDPFVQQLGLGGLLDTAVGVDKQLSSIVEGNLLLVPATTPNKGDLNTTKTVPGICFQNNNKSSFSVQVMFESIFWKSYSGLRHFQQIHLQRGFIILLKFEGCGIYDCIFSFTHLDETVLKTLITHLSAAHGCGPESNPKLMNNHSLTDALPANCRLKGPLNYGGNWALYW